MFSPYCEVRGLRGVAVPTGLGWRSIFVESSLLGTISGSCSGGSLRRDVRCCFWHSDRFFHEHDGNGASMTPPHVAYWRTGIFLFELVSYRPPITLLLGANILDDLPLHPSFSSRMTS
jgi:hypothetical protein